jgi:transcriptional repressor NrdR
MRCLRCGHNDTKVLESRLTNDGRCMRRRRACRNCDYRYTTYEREEMLEFLIKKKDGHVQPYSREKALRSIQIACQKRALKLEDLEGMLRKIEGRLQEQGERIVPSTQLGDMIMEGLYQLDQVAYIRFASVYKDFKDPKEFSATLQLLKEGSSDVHRLS